MKRLKSTFITMFIIFMVIFIYYRYLSTPVFNQKVMMPDRLHPVVEDRANQLVEKAAAEGISILLTNGFRSIAEQDVLYQKGRSSEGNIVTNAKGGQSYHNYGLAIDFAIRLPSRKVIWDRQYDGNGNGVADWTEVVAIAKNLGFEWGGDWEGFKDYPHLQISFGLTIADLQKGKRPPEQPLIVDSTSE